MCQLQVVGFILLPLNLLDGVVAPLVFDGILLRLFLGSILVRLVLHVVEVLGRAALRGILRYLR